VADMYTALSTSKIYAYSIARSCDAGHIYRKDCAAMYLYCAESATKAALDTIQILGNSIEINIKIRNVRSWACIEDIINF